MTNRREFLQIGMAASAWSITTGTNSIAAANTVVAESAVPFYKVIFDTRYGDSRLFADTMRQQKVPLHGIQGDITDFWYKELDAAWKKDTIAIAGMTAHGPLFCLERLAWEQGLKVVYRAEHNVLQDGIMEHKLSAPEMMVAKSKAGRLALAGLDTQWSSGVAKLMQECPVGYTAIEQANLMMPISALSQDDADVNALADPLISWIIAPAKKA